MAVSIAYEVYETHCFPNPELMMRHKTFKTLPDAVKFYDSEIKNGKIVEIRRETLIEKKEGK